MLLNISDRSSGFGSAAMPAIEAVHTESRPSSTFSPGYTKADPVSASCSGEHNKSFRYSGMQPECAAVCFDGRVCDYNSC